MTIFGDEERYRNEGTAGLRGWVLVSFPNRGNSSSEVAGVVFVSPDDPLYVIPMRFFQLSEDEAGQMSNNQRRKRTTTFEEGDAVEFRVDEDGKDGAQMAWILKAKHAPCPLSVASTSDKLFFETVAVVSKGRRPQVYVNNFRKLPHIDAREVAKLEPNVPYAAVFELTPSYGSKSKIQRSARWLRLKDFKPRLDTRFSNFEDELTDKDSKEAVKDAPWNRVTMVSYKNPATVYERGGEGNEEYYNDGRDASYFTKEVWTELAELYKNLGW